MDWKFQREEPVFDEIPVGLNRFRIKSVEKQISKSGNDMLKIVFEVSGHTSWLFHYITFLPDRPEITNRSLTALFDSFGIAEGDFNTQNWVGKVGAGMVKHDDEGRAKVAYLVNREKQEDLPPWQEPGNAASGGRVGKSLDLEVVQDEEDLPF